MNRRHKRQQQEAAKDRLSRVLAAREELALAAGLDINSLSFGDKLRIDQGAVLVLARRGIEARAMAGDVLAIPALERVNTMLVDILPKQQETLRITFNQTIEDRCPSCGFTRPAPNSPAIDPVTGEGVPPPAEVRVASVDKPQPTDEPKVVPIKKQKPEPQAVPPKQLHTMVAEINRPPGADRRPPTTQDADTKLERHRRSGIEQLAGASRAI